MIKYKALKFRLKTANCSRFEKSRLHCLPFVGCAGRKVQLTTVRGNSCAANRYDVTLSCRARTGLSRCSGDPLQVKALLVVFAAQSGGDRLLTCRSCDKRNELAEMDDLCGLADDVAVWEAVYRKKEGRGQFFDAQ